MQRVVFTGGPGVGKSTVLNLLKSSGDFVGRDAARDIIRERKAAGLSPRPEPVEFATEILNREIASYRNTPTTPTYFERGVVEAAGALLSTGAISELKFEELVASFPYDGVFIFPPWEDIYCQDEERDHDFEHVIRVHQSISALYQRLGYRPIEIPKFSSQLRVEFVRKTVHPR